MNVFGIDSSRIATIGAHTEGLAYGLGRGMPWPRKTLPKDMGRFVAITTGKFEAREKTPEGKKNLTIAGIATVEAMGSKPLPGRYMMALSRKVQNVQVLSSGVVVTPSAEEGLAYAATISDLHQVFFIGGMSSWEAGLKYSEKVYITVVYKEADTPGQTYLQKSLAKMAQEAEFLHIGLDPQKDAWDGPVHVEFLEYFRDMD